MNEVTSPHWFLGVDGGGTHCRVKLCNAQGAVLASASAGSANAQLGIKACYHAILQATADALAQAGLGDEILCHTYAGLGLAGAIDETTIQALHDYPHPFKAISVHSDAVAACLGAHCGEDGAILILGTGSCALLNCAGNYQVFGGWGFPISDQGSGALLGLNALRCALQAHDGFIPSSELSRTLMAQFTNNPAAITAWTKQALPKDYAALVPIVIHHYQQQDPLAAQLITQSLHEIDAMLRSLISHGALRISLMGGYAQFAAEYLPLELQRYIYPAQGDAMDGALRLAQSLHREIHHA